MEMHTLYIDGLAQKKAYNGYPTGVTSFLTSMSYVTQYMSLGRRHLSQGSYKDFVARSRYLRQG